MIKCFVAANAAPSLHLLSNLLDHRCSLELGRKVQLAPESYTQSTQEKNNLCARPMFSGFSTKFNGIFPCDTFLPSVMKIRAMVLVILLTHRQTNKLDWKHYLLGRGN